MRYVSTRGEAPVLDFSDVLLAGLARDGGLYVPETWPSFAEEDWRALVGLEYPALAARMFAPFVGDAFSLDELEALTHEAYATFSHKAVTPLVQLGANEWLLELFHGPTFAFKDVAMQVLARMMDAVLARRGGRITIVGATSGDTGSAAIEAFKASTRADIFILHPKGRVSPIQRRQMTTVDAPNVHNIAIEGTFDDAQALVKAMFNDLKFRDAYSLAGINSINWARVMAQTAYYAAASLALGGPARPVAFSVPTGNFGDVLAGYVTKRMGLPIERLVIATNVNDILVRCLTTGVYASEPVKATQSPSMDIQVSSNFERLLFEAYGRDGQAVRALMSEFAADGRFQVSPNALNAIRNDFVAARVAEEATSRMIAGIRKDTGLVIDPHTAVGIVAGRMRRGDRQVPLVHLATAHPAKFTDAVKRALGETPPAPPALAALTGLSERVSELPNDLEAVKSFIAARARAA